DPGPSHLWRGGFLAAGRRSGEWGEPRAFRRLQLRRPRDYSRQKVRDGDARAPAGDRCGDGLDAQGGGLEQEQDQALPLPASQRRRAEEASRAGAPGLRVRAQALRPGPRAGQQPGRVPRRGRVRRLYAGFWDLRRRGRAADAGGLRPGLHARRGREGRRDLGGRGGEPLRPVPGRDAVRDVRVDLPGGTRQEPRPALRAHGVRPAEPRTSRPLDAREPQRRGLLRPCRRAAVLRQPAHRPCEFVYQHGRLAAGNRRRHGRPVRRLRPLRRRAARGPCPGRAGRLVALVARGQQVGRRRGAVPGRDLQAVGGGFLPARQARQGAGGAPRAQGGPLEHPVPRAQHLGQVGLRGPALPDGGHDRPRRQPGQGVGLAGRRARRDAGRAGCCGPVVQGQGLARAPLPSL
ncbi:MAG: Polyhydroxyalkanoic acid synthase, partial [uncultured Rubrobacteraceae bacterium]